MVTAGTYLKLHHFRDAERLSFLQDQLLSLAHQHGWQLQAWAIFSNHYHFVGVAPADPSSLRTLVRQLHSISAREINRRDGVRSRQVFFQYRDTHLSFERSYLARLNYVHQNAVHHHLAATASEYPWCSARWFETTAPGSFFKVVTSFKTDRVRVPDEYDVLECGGLPPPSKPRGESAAAGPPSGSKLSHSKATFS